MTLGVTMLLVFVHFPMWGSMFFPGDPDYNEEDYYIREWSADDVAKVGLMTSYDLISRLQFCTCGLVDIIMEYIIEVPLFQCLSSSLFSINECTLYKMTFRAFMLVQ